MIVTILIGIIISITSGAQDFKRNNARHYKSLYKKQINTYADACSIFEKKRNHRPRSAFRFTSHKPDRKSYDEGSTPQKASKPEEVKKQPERTDKKSDTAVTNNKTDAEDKIEKFHNKEDEVLKENKLPAPSSEKHEEIRKMVADKLKDKKDNDPIDLSPLYFNYNQDEFSVVDMDPFLIAVEYALQGKTILIEGHTDSNGNDKYNVQLSIKRVQKIRQLMHDMGVPDDRISVIGYGEEVAQHNNTTEDGRQKNRRVDFKAF